MWIRMPDSSCLLTLDDGIASSVRSGIDSNLGTRKSCTSLLAWRWMSNYLLQKIIKVVLESSGSILVLEVNFQDPNSHNYILQLWPTQQLWHLYSTRICSLACNAWITLEWRHRVGKTFFFFATNSTVGLDDHCTSFPTELFYLKRN